MLSIDPQNRVASMAKQVLQLNVEGSSSTIGSVSLVEKVCN